MSTNVTSLTGNFFPSPQDGFTTTTSGSVASGAATVGLNSVAGFANGEVATFVIDPTDATKKQTFTGVIDTSGVQVTSVVWTAGTNQTHALGATVVDYATATHIAQMTKGITQEHKQTGAHSDITFDSLTANASATVDLSESPLATTDYGDATVTADKVDFGGSGSGVWWEEIGRTTLGSAGDTITVSSFTAKKYLRIQANLLATGGTIGAAVTFNSDTGSNYARRISDEGGADATGASQSSAAIGTTGAWNQSIVADVTNISSSEKLIIAHQAGVNSAGAASIPRRQEMVGKWANTSSQITTVTFTNLGTGDYAIGSEVIILGHD